MDDQSTANCSLAQMQPILDRAAPSTSLSCLQCCLPLSSPMCCGDPRRREIRAPDSEVISGAELDYDVWLVRSGILRLQRHSYDGRRQILSLFLPGEVVGYDVQVREGLSVETVIESSLCRIDRRKFDTMLSNDRTLRTDILRQKQDQLDRLHWLTWSLGALGPTERLCAFLALSSKFMPCQPLPDGSAVLSMQLPRKDLADLLGTTVESICRIVRKLAEIDIIEIKDPSHFRLLDLKKLIALGRIEGTLERLADGLAARRNLIKGLAGRTPCEKVCFCGR